MITADKTWAGDGWSISDFKELAESGEDIEVLVGYLNSNLSSLSLLHWIFLSDVENSPFLDLEQGISHFDSEEFIQVLELCKKYGQDDVNMDRDEYDKLLREGTIAAAYTLVGDFAHFSSIMERYGDGCHVVGIPKNEGSGNYIREYSYGLLAVNANAEHKEEIAEFIAYLLDYDYQFTTDGSVRMDVVRDSVIQNQFGEYRVRASSSLDPLTVKKLDTKPDGTTWLEEFLDFLESCEPEPEIPQQIKVIISEEANAYFNGARSAREAAGIMHNRVQLYLDENS